MFPSCRRRPVRPSPGVLAVGAMVFAFLAAISMYNTWLISIVTVVLPGIRYAAPNDVSVSWFPELGSTR